MSDPSIPLTPDATSHTEAEAMRALATPVLDPLWMLARQWQTAELQAEDAGSVVSLELTLDTAELDQIETPAKTSETSRPAAAPLQLVIDAEPIPPVAARPLDELAAAGLELLRTLDDHGAGAARAGLVSHYRLSIGDEVWALLEPTSKRRLRPWRDRVPDPRTVVADVVAALGPTGDGPGPLPTLPGPLSSLEPVILVRVEAALRDWLRWLDPAPSNGTSGSYWLPERLESSFSLTATTTTATVRLRAPEHLGGDLDWHSFVRSQEQVARPATLSQRQLLPAPVRYPGMPLPRYWELEDGNVNLDLFGVQDSDVGALALLAFVHQHGSDWFSVPVELPTGSLTVVRSLTVTTTFGEKIVIPAAAELDGLQASWQVFAISPDPDAVNGPLDAASPLVLLHAAGRHLTGPVIEDVLLLRDEMANLAWAVERITLDLSGQPVDRFARYQRLCPAAASGAQPSRYKLGSTVPDYWYPLQARRDAEGRPVLLLSELPGEASEVGDKGVQGRILYHQAGATVRDDEVPREGSLVTRRWHRARWTDGTTHLWAARSKEPGKGQGSSGLRFDYLD